MNTATPLVSAIIPAYNYAQFVARAVDSVLAQDYPNIECVVVNDGSTDNTLEVLAPYGDKIRVITQENAGLSAARNAGITQTDSSLVAFLDADDWWEPDKISRQVREMGKRPQVAAIGCAETMVDADLNNLGVRVFKPGGADLRKNLRGIATRRFWVGGTGSGVMIRREVFAQIGDFDTALKAAEDWDMWMRIAAKYPIYNMPEPLIVRRLHGMGTFRNAVKTEKFQWIVYDMAIERWPEILDDKVRRQMRALVLFDAGGEYAGSNDLVMALKRYRAALKEDWRSLKCLYKVARLSMKARA